ncbi:hypothetical protein IJH33_00570 [Candidatus Saccharibacteria bacterium]|nr:hypothetical protein [Candidatus Saccharibacteria bacterium]
MPSFRRNEWGGVPVAQASRESLAVFDELDAISEEIERCRAQNCRRDYATA